MDTEFHKGRLLDHVHLHVKDLSRSLAFYRPVLEALGKAHTLRVDRNYFSADELFVDADPAATPRAIHIAFQAPDHETVARFHAAGLAAGGEDNGEPGPRTKYHPGYYSAYLIDPDGNNVEAVYHGPHIRTAESVVFKPKPSR